MAIDLISRWEMIQEISVNKQSGTLVVQSGPHYLYWILEQGRLVCVVSSNPELSFTEFLTSNTTLSAKEITVCQAAVSENRSLGAALVHKCGMPLEDLRASLERHWISLTHYILSSSTHIFWSSRPVEPKLDFVRCDIPFSSILMQADRDSLEIPVALRMVHSLQPPFRIKAPLRASEAFLTESEKRLVPYLQAGCSITEMLRDPELDHLTCYRTLFLLWLAGVLFDSGSNTASKREHVPVSPFWQRMKSLPPDWIFPLLAGMVLGVVLAPSGDAPAAPVPVHKLEAVHEILQKPAWRTDPEQSEEETTDAHQ